MGQHRVVEFRRLLDAGGRPLPSHADDVAWLGSMLEILSACRIGARWERAAAACPTSGCTGPIALRRIGDACEWFCANCTNSGAIVGWRGSDWDLTALEERDELDRSDLLLFARLDELSAVRRLALPRELRLPLALAAAHADYVVVPLAVPELMDLLVALDSGHRQLSAEDQRLVERFTARLDSALLANEARGEEPPTLH